MFGVQFDDGNKKIHSFYDWGLLLSSFDVGEATPKTEYVDIVGGDGTLDLTEAYGRIFFDDRTVTITFQYLDDDLRFTGKLDTLTAYFHGKTFKITPDYNSKWYYYGRIEVNKYATSKRLGTITLKATCEPYKYKSYETVISKAINGTLEINCHNSRMPVSPTFLAPNGATFTFGGEEFTLQPNTEMAFEKVVLEKGDNVLIFKGNGNVKISYQEGTL